MEKNLINRKEWLVLHVGVSGWNFIVIIYLFFSLLHFSYIQTFQPYYLIRRGAKILLHILLNRFCNTYSFFKYPLKCQATFRPIKSRQLPIPKFQQPHSLHSISQHYYINVTSFFSRFSEWLQGDKVRW